MITCDTDEVETQLVPSIPTVGTRLIGRYGKGSLDSTRLERFFVNSENVIIFVNSKCQIAQRTTIPQLRRWYILNPGTQPT